MSINRVNLSGNLTRDPELRSTKSGMVVLSFGIAVNDRRKNAQTGEWEDVPNFIDVTMFGKHAESISRFLHKGSKISLDGKLRYSQWEKDGQRRSKLEVVAEDIELMSQRNASQGQQQPKQGQQYQQQGNYPNQQQYQPQNGYQQPQNGYQQQGYQQDVYDSDINF